MGRMYVARAELTLAGDDTKPLRVVPMKPDPLSSFARAFAEVREDLGERAEVALDLMPVTAAQRAHRRRRVLAEDRSGRGGGWRGELVDAIGGGQPLANQVAMGAGGGRGRSRGTRSSSLDAQRGRPGSLAAYQERVTTRALAEKLCSLEPAFELQVLVRARSEIKGRPEALLHALVSCFEQFAGENWLKVAGTYLGFAHLGADVPWRRRRFDRRMDLGLFRPAERKVVVASEVAGLVKPPTMHCRTPNVIRSGGVVPLPPQALPTYTGQPDLLPLGKVRGRDGERTVGVPLADTFFSYSAGRSRYGKTEGAAVRFLALARSGHGCLFLDPHEDAITRMKPYLAGVADRVWEINLSARERQAGWNPLAMEGARPEDVEAKVSAVVSSFESAMQWGAVNNRALTLTTMAAQSLIELALVLPADLAPTLFQMTSILANEDWREEVVPHLSPASQDFWLTRFPRISPDAVTPVTNLIDRLRSSPAVAGLLGSSRSSYDVRRAMDTGAVVLACPAGTGDKDRLVANFFVYDMFRAAKSRKDTPAERRRPFHAFLDEVQTFDGASRGYLAALLEESGKYGMRLHLMSQQPTRLTKTTLDAVLTNRSHLLSTVVGYESARLLSKEWAGAVTPETITRLEKYTFLASVTLNGEVVPPFLVRGHEVSELFDAAGDEASAAMEEAIDANVGRRPIRDTLAALDTLDRRIAQHLRNRRSDRTCSRGEPPDERPSPRPDHVRFGVR
jgi:hypothetical protein